MKTALLFLLVSTSAWAFEAHVISSYLPEGFPKAESSVIQGYKGEKSHFLDEPVYFHVFAWDLKSDGEGLVELKVTSTLNKVGSKGRGSNSSFSKQKLEEVQVLYQNHSVTFHKSDIGTWEYVVDMFEPASGKKKTIRHFFRVESTKRPVLK